LLTALRARVRELGPDIAEVERQRYVAFSRGRRFLAIVPLKSSLRVNLALGNEFEDPRGLVRRRAFAERHPESVWAYQFRIADRSRLDAALDLIGQAYEHVRDAGGDRPWLVDGKAWHLEQRCHARGRAIVEGLMALISKAAPDAEGPDWNQKHYIAWNHKSRAWTRIGTRANQAALFVYGSKRTPESVASDLGYEVFEREAELSDKLALGSSVVGMKDGSGLRVIIKNPRDLDEQRSQVITELLRESWTAFSDQI
jgi:predicted transport protein